MHYVPHATAAVRILPETFCDIGNDAFYITKTLTKNTHKGCLQAVPYFYYMYPTKKGAVPKKLSPFGNSTFQFQTQYKSNPFCFGLISCFCPAYCTICRMLRMAAQDQYLTQAGRSPVIRPPRQTASVRSATAYTSIRQAQDPSYMN